MGHSGPHLAGSLAGRNMQHNRLRDNTPPLSFDQTSTQSCSPTHHWIMSLPPQNNNQPSSSPSKPSLRKTSAIGGSGKTASATNSTSGPVAHFASQATQHHFLPHSPPNQNLEYDEDDEDALTYDDSYQAAPQPQVPLQPFFTLIEDTITNEHYHPTVHYLFADDDPDIITEAACRSLEQNADQIAGSGTGNSQERAQEDNDDYTTSRLPSSRPGVREHYLILDVAPTPATGPASLSSDRLPSPSPGSVETAQALAKSYPYSVTAVQSLSADWQVLRTNITDAPTMNADQQLPGEQHLMLRVEGRGNSPDKLLQRRDDETTENMMERFQTRLAEIRNLMVELDVEERDENLMEEGDMFGGFQPTGFGNAVLDEQD